MFNIPLFTFDAARCASFLLSLSFADFLFTPGEIFPYFFVSILVPVSHGLFPNSVL